MRLSETLVQLIENPHFVTVSGGGGKTSLLITLARYYKCLEKKVLLTTTTKFQSPESFDWGCDYYCSENDEFTRFNPVKSGVFLFANRYEDGRQKWQAPPIEILKETYKKFDACICEADGSRNMPFKIHTDRDPVIPDFATYKIAVMGIWGIGQKINDAVFGLSKDGNVDCQFVQDYLNNPQGLLKGGVDCIIINGAEEASEEQLKTVRNLEWPDNVKVIAGSIRKDIVTEVIK